eukprot:2591753-Pleurochrysis_carterae.AAC.1
MKYSCEQEERPAMSAHPFGLVRSLLCELLLLRFLATLFCSHRLKKSVGVRVRNWECGCESGSVGARVGVWVRE